VTAQQHAVAQSNDFVRKPRHPPLHVGIAVLLVTVSDRRGFGRWSPY
jgi:hypothetical protein